MYAMNEVVALRKYKIVGPCPHGVYGSNLLL